MGYGSRAIEALTSFYDGELYDIADEDTEMNGDEAETFRAPSVSLPLVERLGADALLTPWQSSKLQDESIAVRAVESMPPLLQRLAERKPEQLDYLGVSFGLTRELLRFWKRSGFVPLYASQKPNTLTGESSFVVLKTLESSVAQDSTWLSSFASGELDS